MRRLTIGLLAASTLLASCGGQSAQNEADANVAAPGAQSQPAKLSLTRLDCGSATIKNFDKFFSDKPGFYENGPRDVTVAVWERGAGETLSSGTSAVAVAAAAVSNGWCESPVAVHLAGGDLVVTLDEALNASLVGPAAEICRLELSEELEL